MTPRLSPARAVTLVELMIAVAIFSIIALVGGRFLLNFWRQIAVSSAHGEIQRGARDALMLINRSLRQGLSSTVAISQLNGQPIYSQLTFQKESPSGRQTVSFFQQGDQFIENVDGRRRVLAKNLRHSAFSLQPATDGLVDVSVALLFQKHLGERSVDFYMNADRIRVMNQ